MKMIGTEERQMDEQMAEELPTMQTINSFIRKELSKMNKDIVDAIDKQIGDAAPSTEESVMMMLTMTQGRLGNIVAMKKPYKAAMNDDWEATKQYYRHADSMAQTMIMTIDNDTVFHLAGCNGDNNLLSSLIKIMKKSGLEILMPQILRMQNYFGNTVLHEVASSGDVSCAKTVLNILEDDNDDENSILNVRNKSGETPIYRAAAFGRTEMVKFLAAKNPDNKIHWMRKDHLPILQVAIQGHHFDTALYLLKYDERLRKMTNKYGYTNIRLLCSMPYAFKSGYPMGLWTQLIYFCLPTSQYKDEKDKCHTPQCRNCCFCFGKALSRMNKYFLFFLSQVYPQIGTIQKAKTEHKLAMKLVNKLISYDTTWLSDHITTVTDIDILKVTENETTSGDNEKKKDATISAEGNEENKTKDNPPTYSIPLFLATSNGIQEIVEAILEEYPQAVEQVSDQGQNILHIAVKHRKKEIFDYLKKMTFVRNKMVRKIDIYGNTLLHQVGYVDNDIDIEEKLANPALKLQDELLWFDRVREMVPPYYQMHYNKKKLTARELFNKNHGTFRKEAQEWLKDTAQSCSTVAVLVAGLVFAAAFTAPTNRNSQFFTIFTITDVIALITSLTSVVMFLSILTSPYKLRHFRRSLPWKLVIGFTSLFLSVCATMFTFAATLFLIIDLKGSLTKSLVFSLALFPVSLFALMQFPLYLAFVKTLELASKLTKGLVKMLPRRKPSFQNEKCLPLFNLTKTQ